MLCYSLAGKPFCSLASAEKPKAQLRTLPPGTDYPTCDLCKYTLSAARTELKPNSAGSTAAGINQL